MRTHLFPAHYCIYIHYTYSTVLSTYVQDTYLYVLYCKSVIPLERKFLANFQSKIIIFKVPVIFWKWKVYPAVAIPTCRKSEMFCWNSKITPDQQLNSTHIRNLQESAITLHPNVCTLLSSPTIRNCCDKKCTSMFKNKNKNKYRGLTKQIYLQSMASNLYIFLYLKWYILLFNAKPSVFVD